MYEKSKNPFRPSFGSVPPIFLDREDMTNTVAEEMKEENSPYRTTLIYGLRGSGKTSFLVDVCNAVEKDAKWIVVYPAADGNLKQNLISSIISKTESKVKKFFESTELSLSLFGAGIAKGKKDSNDAAGFQSDMEQLLKRLKEKEMSLLIAIDEVSSTEEIKSFASLYNVLRLQNYPVALIMTGLPYNISELQNDKVLTFLLRSARVELAPLELFSVKYSYKKTFEDAGIKISDSTCAFMAKVTAGYPYAFQLLGYLVWKKAAEEISIDVVKNILDEYKVNLFRNVYTKVYSEMSNGDRKILKIIAHSANASVTPKNLAQELGRTPGYVSTYKKRLLEDQVIEIGSNGQIGFSLPYFKDFVLENEEMEEIIV